MRQKFGQSNGLTSSGRMQGIGSDASYRPSDSSGGIDFDIADVSQKALSFFAAIGEQVTKVAQVLFSFV